MSCEVWFYHLEKRRVEQELPGLLQRGLERGVTMAVVGSDAQRLKDLSNTLWDQGPTSFLAHAMAEEAFAESQSISLCASEPAPNAATFRFYVHGAEPATLDGLTRASIMFDGTDDQSVTEARAMWKRFKADQTVIKYWKQDEDGRWQDQAKG
jgi:DNA polymerase III subunit chi